jgi:hypothetical protein
LLRDEAALDCWECGFEGFRLPPFPVKRVPELREAVISVTLVEPLED